MWYFSIYFGIISSLGATGYAENVTNSKITFHAEYNVILSFELSFFIPTKD
jgi:hypothetical protein